MNQPIFEKIFDRALASTEHERLIWLDRDDKHMAEVCAEDAKDIRRVARLVEDGWPDTAREVYSELDTLVRDDIIGGCVEEEEYVAMEELFAIKVRRNIWG